MTTPLLALLILTAAPLLSTQSAVLPISTTECRSRILSAYAKLALSDVHESGGALIASSKDHSASATCLAGTNDTTLSLTAAGPTSEALVARIEAAVRAAGLTGDAPFTGLWDGGPAWGTITLEQSGNQVRGNYSCCGSGTLRGTVTGNIARLSWVAIGASASSGETTMRVMQDGDLEGSWCAGKGCEPKEEHPYRAKRVR